ncbi:MAG TPA: threonine synthase, partial [Sphingomonas sp.]|nr:threonine synthase [Sphingomonas sp.]
MRSDVNLTADRPTYVTDLECSASGQKYPADTLHQLSDAGKPLLVRYDLERLAREWSREDVETRPSDLWRWRELLPVRRTQDIV